MDVKNIIGNAMRGGAHFIVAERSKWTFYLSGPTCQDSQMTKH
jgi:hypothetical protein